MDKIKSVALMGISLPVERFNQLNNYYIENFGYDYHTQIQNFLDSEYEKCKDYPAEEPEPQPIPHIKTHKGNWILFVKYPDKSKQMIVHSDYNVLSDIWNEWSKYSFSKESKEKVLSKYIPERGRKYINASKHHNNWTVIKNGKQFGAFQSIDDAFIVRDFLIENDWNMKYHSTQLKKVVEGIHQYNYSYYILKVAKGEIKYGDPVPEEL